MFLVLFQAETAVLESGVDELTILLLVVGLPLGYSQKSTWSVISGCPALFPASEDAR